jgi:outer membrane biosynthesis protein TonB
VQTVVQITQIQKRASRNLWLARTFDPPAVTPLALAVSILLHSCAVVFLAHAGGAEPVVETIYEVSIVAPDAVAQSVPLPDVPAVDSCAPDSGKGQVADSPYWLKVRGRIARHLHFPSGEMTEKGMSVTILVQLEISRDGHLLRADLVTPGANPLLAQIVLNAIRESQPFPTPRDRNGDSLPLTVLLPIRFVAA